MVVDEASMSIPESTMADIIIQNQERMERMMNYINLHVQSGNYIAMTNWDVTKHNGIAMLLQGVLLSTIEYEYMQMYPKGAYCCAMCKNMQNMSHETHCYFHDGLSSIVCEGCHTVADRCVKAYVEQLQEEDIGSAEYCNFIDMRMSAEELKIEREEKRHIISNVNQISTTEFMYMNDKTIEDIREEMLAKRVIRKMRARILQRRRMNMFRVLYSCVGLGMDASIVLAQSVY